MSYVAKMCFPDDLNDVDLNDVKKTRSDLRQLAKAGGFAIQFGGVGYTISNNLGIPLEIGNSVYSAYMNAFPGVSTYFKNIFEKTLEDGYITFNDITNRKSFFDFYDKFQSLQKLIDKMDWKEYRKEKLSNSSSFIKKRELVKDYFKLKGIIERRSYNYRVQGSSADITKTAILLIWNYITNNNLFGVVKIANVIHDEILVECPKYMEDTIKEVVYNSMVKAGEMFFTRVKLDAVAEAGDYWIH